MKKREKKMLLLPLPKLSAQATTPTAQPNPIDFGFPIIRPYNANEKADGVTTYSLSAHLPAVIDSNHQPVHATDLTCKLWLVPHVQDGQIVSIPHSILTNLSLLNDPINSGATDLNHTIIPDANYPDTQGLTFNSGVNQVQPCSTDGQVTWKYQVSSSITPVMYDLIVLFDWQGKHYNWSWVNIRIKQASSN